MKDIIVQRAKETIEELYLEYNAKNMYLNKYEVELTANDVKRCVLLLADNQAEQNYLFIGKVVKQINTLLLL